MTNRMWKICACLIGISLLLSVIDYRLTTGYLLGAGAAILLYYRNHSFWNDVVDSNYVKKTTGLLHFVINYAIMGAVLLVPAKFPQYLNIFTCAAGLLIIKWTAYVDAFLAIREKKR